jgi:peptidoglycan/LPS O-acetylase OafA/YrhL
MINRQFATLRGLAIVLVVFEHSIHMSLAEFGRAGILPPTGFAHWLLVALQQLSMIAVPIFLFLSGSFVVYAVNGREMPVAYKVVASALRYIIVPYIVWSLVFYAIAYLFEYQRLPLLGYMKGLLVGYPFNFVPLLVFFYLLGPVLVPAVRRYPWLILVAILVYQVFLLNVVTPGALGVTFPSWTWWLSPPVLRNTLSKWAIYFPLGVVYGLHGKVILDSLRRIWLPLAAMGLVLYGLRVAALIQGWGAGAVLAIASPIPLILLCIAIKRERIPFASLLEQYGSKSYGLYLTNLIVLSLLLAGIQVAAPWLLPHLIIVIPVLFVVTLHVPYWLMTLADRSPARLIQRYVFG